MKDNCIHVSGAALGTCDGNQVQWYSQFKIGNNVIHKKKKNAKMPNNGALKDVKVSEMCGKYFGITCNKEEFQRNHNVFIIDSQSCEESDIKEKKSGILLLMYCVDDYQKHNTGWKWDDNLFKAMKSSKNNIITKKNNHNGSTGNYYSYGNKGNFALVDGSSVGQYTYKGFKDQLKATRAHVRDCAVDCISTHELAAGIDSLSSRVHNIRDLISPIIDAAYYRQLKDGSINLKRVESAKHGVWQSSVCVNAVTEKFHTENDCTSTVIVVPNQASLTNKDREFRFVFQLQQYMNVSFKLKHGISFMFTGKFLTHRQQCTIPCEGDNDIFFNIASYGNNRLYSHMKC